MVKVFICFFLLWGCINSGFIKNELDTFKLKGILISAKYSVFDRNGNVVNHDSVYVKIFSIENLVLYQTPYRFDSLSNNVLLKTEMRNSFFVFDRDSVYGFNFDPYRPEFNERLKIDSVLQTDPYGNFNLFDKLKTIDLTLISRQQNPELNELIENYTGIKKGDTTAVDFAFYYTTKEKFRGYSLSTELDSIKGMKLYKMVLINPQMVMPQYNITIQKHISTIELREIIATNQAETLDYFERYRKKQFNTK
jgi:hypothetical protein